MYPASKWPRCRQLPPGGLLVRYLHSGLFPAHPWLGGHVATIQVWRGNANQPLIIQDVRAYPLYTPPIAVAQHHVKLDTEMRDNMASSDAVIAPQLMLASDSDSTTDAGRSWLFDIHTQAEMFNIELRMLDRLSHNMAPSLLGRDVGILALHGNLQLGPGLDKKQINLLQHMTRGWPDSVPGIAMGLILAVGDSDVPLSPMKYQSWLDMEALSDSQLSRATRRNLNPAPFAHAVANQSPPWA